MSLSYLWVEEREKGLVDFVGEDGLEDDWVERGRLRSFSLLTSTDFFLRLSEEGRGDLGGDSGVSGSVGFLVLKIFFIESRGSGRVCFSVPVFFVTLCRRLDPSTSRSGAAASS